MGDYVTRLDGLVYYSALSEMVVGCTSAVVEFHGPLNLLHSIYSGVDSQDNFSNQDDATLEQRGSGSSESESALVPHPLTINGGPGRWTW